MHLEVGTVLKGYWCVRDLDSAVAWRVHEVYLLAAILVAPAVAMTFAYGRIIAEVRHVVVQRHWLTHARRGNSRSDQANNSFRHHT